MRILDQNIIEEVTRRLVSKFRPEEIWLFGSHVWGEADEGSDLDLLVIIRDSSESPVRRAQRAHRCLRGLGIAKDVIVKTRREVERFRNVPSSLEAAILDRGRRIYG